MASTSSREYKRYDRARRQLVTESAFTGGMHFTDNPLSEGVSKLVVNMIQKDFGQRVRPRGGWRTLMEPVALGSNLGEQYIHHTGTTFVVDTVTQSVALKRYALVLKKHDGKYGTLEDSRVILEQPYDPLNPESEILGSLEMSSLVSGATPYHIKHDGHDSLVHMHNMLVENVSPTGIHASIDGNTYVLTPNGLGRLHVYVTNGAYTHEVKLVEPLEVTPMQAVNYGYNMLLSNPYDFSNKEMPNLRLQGILPYDFKTDLLKMQAKVGEPVRFKLIYEYKKDEQYKVKWEVQDIYRRDGIIVIQTQQESPTYVNGAEIFLDHTSPLKQFSVIATVYRADNLDEPVRVMQLASYHLADDVNNVRMEQQNYDLMTAKGMTVWKNQLVYYGVLGAEMSVIISDVNDPTYVPFPNSTVIFNEKVVKVFPYLESLIVVTEHTMFQVDFAFEDGFTQKPVQANMQLRDDDAASMYGVRNLVCFKSKNYYYMVVPNIKNDKGELQIAPISNNITMLLDHFAGAIRDILSEVYTLRNMFKAPNEAVHITLQDYKSYPDGNRLRHVYKLQIEVYGAIRYIDFHLVYDTIFRAWTIEAMESTRRPLHVFQSISTGYAQFLNLYTHNTTTYIQWIGVDENNPEDEFALDNDIERLVPNFQMLDTGKRDMAGAHKKRMRHVILEFNNLSNEDILFNHIITLDDDQRTDLFSYNTVHVTDKDAPNYGQIYVERDFVEPTTLHGTTKLGMWSLGNSQFPQQTILKAHLDVSGKGYYPRFRLITRTSKLYELNTISWSFRDMYAR